MYHISSIQDLSLHNKLHHHDTGRQYVSYTELPVYTLRSILLSSSYLQGSSRTMLPDLPCKLLPQPGYVTCTDTHCHSRTERTECRNSRVRILFVNHSAPLSLKCTNWKPCSLIVKYKPLPTISTNIPTPQM